jgi:phosphatidylserine decarboxylase
VTKAFSAWKVGAVYYAPALLLGLVCLYLVIRGHKPAWIGVAIFVAYGLFSLFFFRDPPRTVTAQQSEVVSPADGAVVAIEDLEETPYYQGPCRRISIFLSILSVHVNRAPFDGTVRDVQLRPGRFKNAMKPETSDVNESNTVWLDTPRGPMTVRQIAGAVARRIVCVAGVGDGLAKGEKFGMIKFGSRTELYLPREAEIRVKVKDNVWAGTTIVARFP